MLEKAVKLLETSCDSNMEESACAISCDHLLKLLGIDRVEVTVTVSL